MSQLAYPSQETQHDTNGKGARCKHFLVCTRIFLLAVCHFEVNCLKRVDLVELNCSLLLLAQYFKFYLA